MKKNKEININLGKSRHFFKGKLKNLNYQQHTNPITLLSQMQQILRMQNIAICLVLVLFSLNEDKK